MNARIVRRPMTKGGVADQRLGVALAAASLAFVACGHVAATASSERLAPDPEWLMVRHVPIVRQTSDVTCGAAALAAVLTYEGRPTTIADVAAVLRLDPVRGLLAGDLRDFANRRGAAAFLIAGTPTDLSNELTVGRPVLVGLVEEKGRRTAGHYVVVVGLRRDGGAVLLMDPARGWREQRRDDFLAEWSRAGHVTLVLMPAAVANGEV